ncbi:transcription factor HHO3-like isoform X2 [Hevea brasiliensis]|uniref:transcription factor HHO3-like isoform X2 n=1 Tax=Hevea brasiliensis TaxID=3981 RepID=UPI0025D8E5CA|nr:transcription factor HHO3-like isoform X2 [Hevea brasiliensis]
MDYAEKMQKCHEYVEALEEEKPIGACRRELSGTTTEYMHGQSECSEQTSCEGTRPVLEEFIPIKKTNSSSDNDKDNNDQEKYSYKRNKNSNTINDKNSSDHKKKSDWLRSVQLWNPSPDPSPREDVPRKAVVSEVKRNGAAFQPFQKEKTTGKSIKTIAKTPSSVPASATSSTADTGTEGIVAGSSRKEEKEGESQRKQRRCWSQELHRRFLHSLQQLGGSHVATPKQIRELMKVDGLTNDEVKSHLQKYRLHTRRPSPTIHNNSNPQAPQFVVVGGIWVPPPEYAAVAPTTASGKTATIAAAANGIYAPVAAPPPTVPQTLQKQQHTQSEQMQLEERGSHSEGGFRANSPATSSSTHTTTNSPSF